MLPDSRFQVFKLPPELGCPPHPPGKERLSQLTEPCLAFLNKDKELAMFVEDFIIDAYSIQLREEVGDVTWALTFSSVSDPGRTCVLALLFHLNKKQGGTGGSEWLPAVLQGGFAPLLCCHVLQPWPGRAHQAEDEGRHLQEPLWSG